MNHRSVIWAFHPSENFEPLQQQRRAIEMLQRTSPAALTPVSILSPREFEDREEMESWLSKRQKELSKLVAVGSLEQELVGSKDSVLLFEKTSSLRSSVDRLVDYVQKSKGKMIVVGTEARRGLRRLEKGSFAEEVIARSSVPVLTVNQKMEIPKKMNSILFGTDFSKESRSAFLKLLVLAKKFEAKVSLFHVYHFPIDALSPLGERILNDKAWVAGRKETLAKGKKWCEFAKKRGVPCQFVLKSQGLGLAPSLLNELEEEKNDILALGLHRGSLTQRLFGFTLREILRTSLKPVLTFNVKISMVLLAGLVFSSFSNAQMENSPGNPLFEAEGKFLVVRIVPGKRKAEVFLAGKKSADLNFATRPHLLSVSVLGRKGAEELHFQQNGNSYSVSPLPEHPPFDLQISAEIQGIQEKLQVRVLKP